MIFTFASIFRYGLYAIAAGVPDLSDISQLVQIVFADDVRVVGVYIYDLSYLFYKVRAIHDLFYNNVNLGRRCICTKKPSNKIHITLKYDLSTNNTQKFTCKIINMIGN